MSLLTCALCGDESVPLSEWVEHLRLMHPDDFAELSRWPDGGIVVSETFGIGEPGPWDEVQ